ncbi:GFA family protein [Shewanella sp. AS1]|uniref:GFA family protein n=1 Tax=Shewanella sp. AS1 TaxID=2907626 RepID=UPI001F3485CC|nr:GFA family protein [Shewanella sp. AS1]MCE9679816.1 GFA family protein [Shewanella sp. AS1]
MAKGQCNCGAVAFEIDGEVTDIYVCHCSICRRYTGNNGVAVVIASNDKFRWLKGAEQVTTWRKPVGDWESRFCRICGSSLPMRNSESSMAVPAGSIIEGGDKLQVKHHIWVDSKASWDEIGDAGKQHLQAFEGSA